jgi:hypothetical protein
MNLVGGIKSVENGPGGREPDHGQRKSLHKHTRNDVAAEKNAQAAVNHSSTECHNRIGRTVDTSA